MLVSVGYKEENIEYIEGVEDSLELTEEMDEEEYKILVRTELEKEEYREFFDSIGMHYLGEGKWDLREMK